jgi:Na+-translocating ferredoxin:NAD+ oxidoreductase subunit G
MTARIEGLAAEPSGATKRLPVMEPKRVPSWRLLLTLGGAGASAGLFIVLVFGWTAPRIEAHRAMVLRTAIEEVLHAPSRADTLYLHNNVLAAAVPAGVDGAKLERIYLGYDDAGRQVGYAITASEAGFADQIVLVFGYDPARGQVLGMKILASKETPGLGDKIEHTSFTEQFISRLAPLVGVKSGTAPGPNSIVMITGATISSRTVIKEINNAAARWAPLIEQFERTRQ